MIQQKLQHFKENYCILPLKFEANSRNVPQLQGALEEATPFPSRSSPFTTEQNHVNTGTPLYLPHLAQQGAPLHRCGYLKCVNETHNEMTFVLPSILTFGVHVESYRANLISVHISQSRRPTIPSLHEGNFRLCKCSKISYLATNLCVK